MAAPSSDKVLTGVAALVAVASAIAFGLLSMRHPDAPAQAPKVALASTDYAPTAPAAPPVKIELWNAPGAQSRGREWIYDTFTPPEIFYNARTKQFTVKPPSSLADEQLFEPFGLDLVSVRREPFRLQLIGYVGDQGNWRGIFQNTASGETIVAGAGHRVAKLGLVIKGFDVSMQPIVIAQSMTTKQRVATAVVHDEKSRTDVTITHRERVFTGALSAFVAATGDTATREVRAGDAFKLGEVTYKVEKIELTPPVIEVTKESAALPGPVRETLRPREPETPETPGNI